MPGGGQFLTNMRQLDYLFVVGSGSMVFTEGNNLINVTDTDNKKLMQD